MSTLESEVPQLLERYARYQSLLDEVSQAIEARSQHELSTLEAACRHVLQDMQLHWSAVEGRLRARGTGVDAGDTAWALLESAMGRAAEQLALNQAALAQWAGEVGATLHEAKIGGTAAGVYGMAGDMAAAIFGTRA